MLRILPGREEEFYYIQDWLAASAALEHMIANTEEDGACGSPVTNGATDNSWSRLIGSLSVGRDMNEPSHAPQRLLRWPVQGGTRCSTCT
jgi:hypothetical protein